VRLAAAHTHLSHPQSPLLVETILGTTSSKGIFVSAYNPARLYKLNGCQTC
jgi:hypothetical protein